MSDQETVRNEVSGSEDVPSVSSVNRRSMFDFQDIEKHKGIACLSYVSLLFLVPLLTKKESRFAQFHARQGMTLFMVWIVSDFVLRITPIFGWKLIPVANLFFVVVSIIGIIKTFVGEAWEIPGVSVITKKINL